jgi:hypothetical protein
MSFIVNPYVYGGCPDADANAFLTATGITNATISSAICTLVTSMKANGTWAKCNAIYPFVGGTATTHMYNLKNPANTNAAFRLSFVGGWTHSSNGGLPNGTNAYADTFLNPTTTLSLNSSHISYYSRTNIAQNFYDMGAGADPSAYIIIASRNTSNTSRFIVYTGNLNDVANSDSRGLFISNRTSSTVINGFKNTSKILNLTQTAIARPNRSIFLGALNYQGTGGAVLFSSKQCAFATIGSGLTDAEAANLYSTIQTFQTTLGRQV